MAGNSGFIKKFVFISLLLSVSSFFLLSGSGQDDRFLKDSNVVQKKIRILKKISDVYSHDWKQLGRSKMEVESLRHKARRSILSNIGVVMFKGLANVIQKFFDTPSPDGLLQDILQEMLFDTESKAKEREMIQFWTKRNFLRRKKLRETYTLLEQVLRAPLERFDNDQESFRYAEELWKKPVGKSDKYLRRIMRRLNVIIYITMELSGQIDNARDELMKDKREVENEILRLRSQQESPQVTGSGELLVNGRFSQGLESWIIGGGGYSGNPKALKTVPPRVEGSVVSMGVYGGTCSIVQMIPATRLNLKFKARFRVIRWSTFDKGVLGGWAAVNISFCDRDGNSLASTYYYLNPHAPSNSRKGLHWVRLNPASPVPTRWFEVECDVASELKFHQLDSSLVSKILVIGIVFGTHEDQTLTIGHFADFSLKEKIE